MSSPTLNPLAPPSPLFRWLLILLLALFCLLPHFDRWKGEMDELTFSAVESRRPAPKPAPVTSWTTLAAWTRGWNAYMTDRLGFRKEVIVAGQWLKWKAGLPTAQAVWGKEGWVFLNHFADLDMPAYLRGTVAESDFDAPAFVRTMEQRQHWLAEQGIPMLVVIAPAKGTVYPEYLPDNIRPIAPNLRERFLAEVEQHGSSLRILDLLPGLLAAKRESPPLYFKTDTHWNEMGAAVAYRAILRQLQPDFPGLEGIPEDFLTFTPVPCIGLDLGVLSSLKDYMTDTRYDTSPQTVTHVQRVIVNGESREQIPQQVFQVPFLDATLPVDVYTDRTDQPRVLLFRDSYAGALSFYLNETFAETHYRHHFGMTFDPAPVREIKPDLVIYIFVDRALLQFHPLTSTHFEQEILSGP